LGISVAPSHIMSDGNLRPLFKQYLPDAMWVPIETWSTGVGVPDTHYCFAGGRAGWIENKVTDTFKIKVQPGQIGWLERYSRLGGRCFVAVRRLTTAGPRKGLAVDELWIYRGSDVRAIAVDGLKGASPLVVYPGGPVEWVWGSVKRLLISQ
jgi:hypothetical protein